MTPPSSVAFGRADQAIDKLLTHGQRSGRYSLGISFHGDEFYVYYEFGKEAEDSPMVGGAAYGHGGSVESALRDVLDEVGL